MSSLNPQSINGLNLYVYANNNPIAIAYNTSSIGGSVNGGMVSSIPFSIGGTISSTSNPLTIKFPSQNWVSIGADLSASLSGALSVINWTVKNPEFYDFLYSAYGLSQFEMLDNLKSPLTKGAKAFSYLLLLHDVGSDVVGHINAGDSWQTTAASGAVTVGVGALNIWASTKVGAAIGGAIGGGVGLIIGTVSGAVAGVVINGIFYTEINGKSIAGYIEGGIEWFLELF